MKHTGIIFITCFTLLWLSNLIMDWSHLDNIDCRRQSFEVCLLKDYTQQRWEGMLLHRCLPLRRPTHYETLRSCRQWGTPPHCQRRRRRLADRGSYESAPYQLDPPVWKRRLCKHCVVFTCIENGVIVCFYIVLAWFADSNQWHHEWGEGVYCVNIL